MPQSMQTAVFHPSGFTGSFHGCQQVPVADMLPGLGGENKGTAGHLSSGLELTASILFGMTQP